MKRTITLIVSMSVLAMTGCKTAYYEMIESSGFSEGARR